VQSSSFLESETILRALEFASAKGGFATPQQRKTAAALIKRMKSNKSLSGRHQQLRDLLKRGATIEEMIRSVGASRRTIFRYLNHFEQAGLTILLENGKYRIKS
jgi:predicted DNA-binding transcriptional regulator YafY